MRTIVGITIIAFIMAAFIIAHIATAQSAFNPARSDVNDRGYSAATVTVGTSEVEAKVGGTRDEDRQRLLLYNNSANVVYYGPTGVTTSGSTQGIPIIRRQVVVIPVGDVAVYLIAGSAGNSVIVQELK